MAKQAKVKLTMVQHWTSEVNKWRTRREDAIAAMVKSSTHLLKVERRLERAKKTEARKKREAKAAVMVQAVLPPEPAPGRLISNDPTDGYVKPKKARRTLEDFKKDLAKKKADSVIS